MVKPIAEENLFANLELLRMKHLENDQLLVEDGKKEHSIKLSQIQFIKSEGNYCSVQTVNGKQLMRGSLSGWLSKSDQFVRVHKSYVVNEQMIGKKGKTEILLKNGTKIPFSATFSDGLKD